MSRSCAHPYRASRWCTGLAEAWLYDYTDFGEGRGRSPQPVLRAVVEVATPQAPSTFQAVIDTGGPTNEVPIYELTLEVRSPSAIAAGRPIAWRGAVAAFDPGGTFQAPLPIA